MKLNVAVFAIFSVLASALPSASQALANLDEIEPPVLTETPPPDLNTPALLLQSPLAEPLPPPANRYRANVKELASHKHQFVHFRLRNGKVLTGLIRDVSQEGFTLHTDALGGPYIRYEEIVEQPRPVPAVGTRIKHGAEWTGLGVLIAAAIPLVVVLFPLAITGILPDC
jgi:hypothetical protein